MQVKASLKNLRISPRKVRLVANSIVGMNVQAALVHLGHTVKKTSTPMEKLLNSAVSNAENNFGLDKDNLFVHTVLVGEGTRLKRWLPRAQGRATQILKRTSIVDIILEERVEGKNRRSKEELEKERKQREEARTKAMKEAMKEMEEKGEAEEEVKEDEKATVKKVSKKAEAKGKGQKDGFMSKVFQRKSM